MGKVRVRLFARLAELAGTRETELEIGEGLTAGDVFVLLSREHPPMAGMRVAFAVNHEYADAGHQLREGDELALIPPVSGGTDYFELTAAPLDAEKLVECVRRDEAGAVVLFYGVVRNENMGRRVLYLEYDAYAEMAEAEMRRVADDIRARWPAVTEIAVQHRTGRLEIGEVSLLVAVSAPHRREAFEAAHSYVDLLKERVPVWKKEVFEGGEEWIERELSRGDQA